MLKNIVLKQKQEKERLLSLPYIERTKSVEAKKWLDSNLIKVILGPRRAGKSVFALMLLAKRPFAYFNFDDEQIMGQCLFDCNLLMQELRAAYGPTKHILFDEIQNLPNWEPFVNRLQREGYNLVLTGSNANLLSKGLATALTGRHIPLEIFPFNFLEFLHSKAYRLPQSEQMFAEEKGQLLHWLEQYSVSGGYPEVATKNLDAKGYLAVLFDSLLFKDVVKRHKVRFSTQIDALASYLINNTASQYSLRKISSVLGFRSGVTLEKYLQYLIDAYLVFSLTRYSYKTGVRLTSPRKIYVVDNGFIEAKAVSHSPDFGHLLENLVFTELVKHGITPNRHLFYYQTRNNREVDFVLKQGTIVTELIQVAYELNNQDAEKREVKVLTEASQELKVKNLTIVTWDEEKTIKSQNLTINVMPVWKRILNI